MAESADALDSGSSGSNTVCVQVTLSAPKKNLVDTSSARFFFMLLNGILRIKCKANRVF